MGLFKRLLAFSFFAVGIALLSGCVDRTSDKTENDVSISPKEEGIIKIARVNESAGDFNTAERQYKEAVAMSGNRVGARLELADFYKRHNASQAAINTLTEAHTLRPKNSEILRALANAYINAGSTGKALELLNEAISLNSRDPLLYNSRGVALDMLGRYDEAQKSYQTAMLLNPNDDVTFKTNLSMSYILSGSYNKAIALLMPLLNSPQATPNIRQNLALAYGLSGQSDKALRLGLKDLSTKEAEENLKFYRMLAVNQNAPGGAGTWVKSIAVEDKTTPDNPFLEDADRDASIPPFARQPAPRLVTKTTIKPVIAKEEDEEQDEGDEDDIPSSQPSTAIKPATIELKPSSPIPYQPDTAPATLPEEHQDISASHTALPLPVLKPDKAD